MRRDATNRSGTRIVNDPLDSILESQKGKGLCERRTLADIA